MGTQYEYSDSTCETIINEPIFEYDDECGFLQSISTIDVFYRIGDCVVNGQVIFENDLCGGNSTMSDISSTMDQNNDEDDSSANMIQVIFASLFMAVFVTFYY